jgi:glycosidase
VLRATAWQAIGAAGYERSALRRGRLSALRLRRGRLWVDPAFPACYLFTPVPYRSLYQINTRVYLTELSSRLRRRAVLDDIPDADLDRLAAQGFDWIWMLSVWQTGTAGQRVSRTQAEWRRAFERTLPDLRDADIAGSGFAITGYITHERLGGDAALARLRDRLRARGLRLMLDFVPNHTGLDHPWVLEHPEYYIAGTDADLEREPQNYTRVNSQGQDRVLAYGRDPYFSGWPDTLQLDYSNPQTQDAMMAELLKIADQCDGLRCDMAMLVQPDVFERTWGRQPQWFWPRAINLVRERIPGFCFMAEVYWDLEWSLLQEGFDYAYDKRLYDRLRDGHARAVREHFHARLEYQDRLARFLENHDEPRAAATFAHDVHEAAAIITFLSPGLRFFHEGQLDGRQTHVSPHLVRAPNEPPDEALRGFYDRLLSVVRRLAFTGGRWQLADCMPAWEGNSTSDGFLAWTWQGPGAHRAIVAVNYNASQGQCYVRLPFDDLAGRVWRLSDLTRNACYDRGGDALTSQGLFLDLRAWGYHVFDLKPLQTPSHKRPAGQPVTNIERPCRS